MICWLSTWRDLTLQIREKETFIWWGTPTTFFNRVSLFFIFNFFVMKIPSLWLLNLVILVLWSRRKKKQSGYDFLHWLISKPVHLKFCEKKSNICFYRNLNLRYWICIQLRIYVTVSWLSSKLVFSKGVTFEGFVQLSWCFRHFLF